MAKFIVKKESLKLTSVLDWTLLLLIFSAITLILNQFGRGTAILESIPGMLILAGITLAGLILEKIIPLNLPAIIYISIISLVIALPVSPIGAAVSEYTSKVNTLAICTAILTYSGVAIGKSWADFRRMSWKGIAITLCVITGTYLGSAIVAQIVLKVQGIA